METKIAYFSMEVGLCQEIPTYSGGLGVLAGDTIKAAADVGLPLVAVTMLYHKGYFVQHLAKDGRQSETPVAWHPKDQLTPVDAEVSVLLEGRPVTVKAWRYDVKGAQGHIVPVYFLDTSSKNNSSYDQTLSDCLYGGDDHYRLCQEVVLGMAGVKLLKAVDKGQLCTTYHMNEGHAALLTLQLLQERVGTSPLSSANKADLAWVKERCVFTTHTPVKAGHDSFSEQLVGDILGPPYVDALIKLEVLQDKRLNMTTLALKFSRFANGVAKRHGEVSREMFKGRAISSVTNGIHANTWAAESFQKLFDEEIPEWRVDNNLLRYLCDVPAEKVWNAHQAAKQKLIDEVATLTGESWQKDVFTIGFARRAATYKRADLLFTDIERLAKIAADAGGLQIVFSGKAHPKDEGGKALITSVHAAKKRLAELGSKISLVYLENYGMHLGAVISAGVDVWLNNPVKPLEASGTSGMKAALNGIPSLSTLDGWWVEGCYEGVTGWEIRCDQDGLKTASEAGDSNDRAADSLYEILADKVLPLYLESPKAYWEIAKNCISINASYFNTQRMVQQYQLMAYQQLER